MNGAAPWRGASGQLRGTDVIIAKMSYADFTLETVESLLGVRARGGDLFPGLAPVPVPDWLRSNLDRGKQLALVSEKARSEFIVAPILLACRERSGGAVAIFSGERFDVDPGRGLTGECDFVLTLSDPIPRLRAPIATVVEAKKNDIDAGLAQCIAQMVAARDFNDREQAAVRGVHGCVTTGEDWQFLRLEGSAVTIDRTRLYIDNVGGILGVFEAIVAWSQPAAALSGEAEQSLGAPVSTPCPPS